jgi:ATP-dependent Lon protease
LLTQRKRNKSKTGEVMTKKLTKNYPLLPLRNIVIFPQMVVPLFVGREKSIKALELAAKSGDELFLVTQKDEKVVNPVESDLYTVGTVVKIIQMLKLPDGTVKVMIEGLYRASFENFEEKDKTYYADISESVDSKTEGASVEASIRSVKSAFDEYNNISGKIPGELRGSIGAITDGSRLVDVIISHILMDTNKKQELLTESNVEKRLQLLLEKLQGEIEVSKIEEKLRENVRTSMEKSQKEYYLNEQMNAIQKEMGNKGDEKSDIEEYEEKLEKLTLPDDVRKKATKEIKKLKSMSPMSAESGVVRNYVDWIVNLPWDSYSEEDNSVKKAKEVLNDDHYGLEDVKDRILEYLAVKSLVNDNSKTNGTILCLAGPPGVGKTSICKSLATSMGREFVRVSLGGVKDESEIRGHRRTYVGAMPGKIIQGMKKAGTGNPVILLDEIDKMSSDSKGDPASAMLEVLDPAQNKNFQDHYMEVDYDLSKVMFVMTANDIGRIPVPLRDRMEIIHIAGYTPDEKLEIARDFIVKRSTENNGLKDYKVEVSDEMLTRVIKGYTREAGVRGLERQLNTVARKIATNVVTNEIAKGTEFNITEDILTEYLGPIKFEGTEIESTPQLGLVNGLAWTSVGGELLNIEVVTVPGKGKIQVTGKLGETMQESAKTALSYVRSISSDLGVTPSWYDENDIHIHVPDGATPKDGPSAGITMATALVSAIAGIPVKQDVAMTGEISLRGRVMPIGGLKEKLLAAKSAGIKTVVIPYKNAKDLEEIPEIITSGLNIYPTKDASEVLKLALDLKAPEKFLEVELN